MRKVLSEKYCTGCSACSIVCPVHAIQMKENYEGFYFPEINQHLCINCKECIHYCPVINMLKQQTTNNKQQTTNNKQQTTNNKQQTTNNKQQTTNNKQQTTNNNTRFEIVIDKS